MRVPTDALSPEALRGLVEEFITREGTDYGGGPTDLEEKVAQVMLQLKRGDVVIVFDPELQTANLMPARDLPPEV